MNKYLLGLKYGALLFLFCHISCTQDKKQSNNNQSLLISGPMLGYVSHQEVCIWLEVPKEAKKVKIKCYLENIRNKESKKSFLYKGTLGKEFNPIKILLTGLQMNSKYEYEIEINDEVLKFDYPLQFTTQRNWVSAIDTLPPPVSLLFGSCVYINDSAYDWPGKPYGKDPRILETMGNIKTDMMLWLGDNVYLRAPDYTSSYGIQARYSKNFATPEMQKLRATRSNIAIWDDHDFGPNDAVKNYELKDETYNAFVDYWGNKTFGENDNKGIYSLYSWYDCDFLLMDDRFHRDANELPDSIDGKANPNKRFWGEKQFEWLKTSLISSDANFKFICTGNQVLNPDAQKECVRHYPYEFNELMDFIIKNKISGVVFLTGDRHFSELIKYQPAGSYPMYDFTCSSITSSIHKIKDAEINNPYRVPSTLLEVNNFGRISISGIAGKRELKMETLDIDGKVRWTYSVNQSQLKF